MKPANILAAALAAFCLFTSEAGAVTPPLIVDANQLPELIAREHPVILSTQSSTMEKNSEPGFLKGAYTVDEDLWTDASRSQAELDDLVLWSVLT